MAPRMAATATAAVTMAATATPAIAAVPVSSG